MPMIGTLRGPSLSEDEEKKKVHVSGNVNENKNKTAQGTPVVVDTGLLVARDPENGTLNHHNHNETNDSL